MMSKTRRSKTTILVEEFAEKIKNGTLVAGNDFFTMKELMIRYRISIGTANKVLQELQTLGLLDVQRGRKSKITNVSSPQPPRLSRPVGVITPVKEPFRMARWREALLQEVQRRLLMHGNQSLWLPENFDPVQNGKDYSGFIYATEEVPAAQWQSLLDAGVPCARISFDRPYFNTLFVDYRPVLDRVILHMAAAKCKRTIFLTPSEQERAFAENWFQRHGRVGEGLDEYGITRNDRVHLMVIPSLNIGMDQLEAEVGRNDDKIAFVVACNAYSPFILRLMDKLGRKLHEDYEIYSLSFIENEIQVGNRADLKYAIIAKKVVDMFYRQCLSGEKQLGEVMFAEFIPGE